MAALLQIAGRWGGILTVIALVITLLTALIKFVAFMMAAIKILIVVVFVGLMIIIVVTFLNGRRKHRREAEDF